MSPKEGERTIMDDQSFTSPETNESNQELVQAVEKFDAEYRDRSFSGRHPELGRMIKCDGCGRRHRSSIIHERKFATDIKGVPCPPRIAETKRYRHQANRYGWRERPNPLILLLVHAARKAKA